MERPRSVTRPIKRAEYELVFGSTAAAKGWSDLRSQARNALADAWDYLTVNPMLFDARRCYQLRGDLATVTVEGVALPQWQYKVTDGGRLWYAVREPHPSNQRVAGLVVIVLATAGHPSATDGAKNSR